MTQKLYTGYKATYADGTTVTVDTLEPRLAENLPCIDFKGLVELTANPYHKTIKEVVQDDMKQVVAYKLEQPNQTSPLSIGQWKTDKNIKVVITTKDGEFWVGHLEGNPVVTMLYDTNGNFASGFDAGKLMKCRRGDEKW